MKPRIFAYDCCAQFYPINMNAMLTLSTDMQQANRKIYDGVIFHVFDEQVSRFLKNNRMPIIYYRVPSSRYDNLKKDLPAQGINTDRLYHATNSTELSDLLSRLFI